MAISQTPTLIYDWTDVAQLDEWQQEIHGNGTITIDTTTEELVFLPQQNVINGVDLRKTGAFNRVDIWVALTGHSSSATKYFDISIGAGPITDTDSGGNANWWHASLNTSVIFATQTMGSDTGAYIREKNNGASTQAFAAVPFPSTMLSLTKITFLIDGGYARIYYNDIFQGEWPTALLEAGDVHIHQGEYSSGAGAIARISRIELYTLDKWFVGGNVSVDGLPSVCDVRLYSVETNAFIAETTTDAQGNYLVELGTPSDVFVMAVPPAGYAPLMHGPITPKLGDA
jgi:hypothetical protein